MGSCPPHRFLSQTHKTDDMNTKRSQIFLILLIFLVGLGIFLYPALSDLYYNWQYEKEIAAWEASLEKKDYTPLWAAAESYNQELAENQGELVLSKEEKAYVSTLLNPLGNGMMGYVDIPKIKVHLPIYQGTEEKELQSGCGWWFGTSLPTGGENTHCVITAHNGLVKAKLFTDLDQLVEGDRFTLTVPDRVMTYEVDQILTTLPEDFEPLKIVPGEDYVTLYTCIPYGVNTHRLLVRGHRIEIQEEPEQEETEFPILWIAVGIDLILILIIRLLIWNKKRYRGKHFAKRSGSRKAKSRGKGRNDDKTF